MTDHSASSNSSFTGHQCQEALCPEHSLVSLIILYSLSLETQQAFPLSRKHEIQFVSCALVSVFWLHTAFVSLSHFLKQPLILKSLLASKMLRGQLFEHPQVVCKQSTFLWVSSDSQLLATAMAENVQLLISKFWTKNICEYTRASDGNIPGSTSGQINQMSLPPKMTIKLINSDGRAHRCSLSRLLKPRLRRFALI